MGVIQAQILVQQSDNFPAGFTSERTMDVASADLNGDNLPDLVLAMEAAENRIFFNAGNGQYVIDSERLLPEWNTNDNWTGEDSEDIGIADFDGDNDLDLLFVSEDTPAHELLLNDGTGKFTFAAYQFPGSIANALAILDLNDDDQPDVIIGNNGQNRVFINNGDASFTEATSDRWPVNTNQTQDLKVVDIDLDNDLDIVEGIEVGGNNIYINDGNGVFSLSNDRLPFTSLMETRKVAVGDINGDNAPDLFYCNVGWVQGADLQNRLLLNDGNGFFSDVSNNLPINSQFTLDAVFFDLNNDNHQDLITVGLGNTGNNYQAFFNDGTGQFTAASSEVFGNPILNDGIGLMIGDFNGDSTTDLYVANFNQTDRFFFSQNLNRIEERTLTDDWTLGPLPCQDILNIQAKVANGQSTHLRLFDAAGQLIQECHFTDQLELKMDKQSAGIYTLELQQDIIHWILQLTKV